MDKVCSYLHLSIFAELQRFTESTQLGYRLHTEKIFLHEPGLKNGSPRFYRLWQPRPIYLYRIAGGKEGPRCVSQGCHWWWNLGQPLRALARVRKIVFYCVKNVSKCRWGNYSRIFFFKCLRLVSCSGGALFLDVLRTDSSTSTSVSFVVVFTLSREITDTAM